MLKSLKETYVYRIKKSGIIHFNSEANKYIPFKQSVMAKSKETSLEDASKKLQIVLANYLNEFNWDIYAFYQTMELGFS